MVVSNNKLLNRLSHNVVTRDVDRDVSTAYCESSSGDGVDCSIVTICINADRNPPIALDYHDTNGKESTPSLDEDWR